MKGYRDLKVWQFSLDLVEKIYLYTKEFPREELYGLTSQMRRAAVSVPSNIAEGHGRGGRYFLQFLDFAYGSLAELDTQIELSTRLGYLNGERAQKLRNQSAEIAKMLNGLKNSLNKKLTTDN